MNVGRIKKKLMELLWRIQASQTLISIAVWSLMLTGIFYTYAKGIFSKYLGIGEENLLFGMVLLFLITLSLIIGIGIVFDKLRFWKEQQIVIYERNPYTTYKLTPKEIQWIKIWLMSAKAIQDKSEKMKEEIEFFEEWVKKSIGEDEKLRKEIESLRSWVYEKR